MLSFSKLQLSDNILFTTFAKSISEEPVSLSSIYSAIYWNVIMDTGCYFYFFLVKLVKYFIMRPSSLGGGRILRRTLSVRLSVCPSVPLSLPSVTSFRQQTMYVTDVLFGTHWGPHIVRPSRPYRFLFYFSFFKGKVKYWVFSVSITNQVPTVEQWERNQFAINTDCLSRLIISSSGSTALWLMLLLDKDITLLDSHRNAFMNSMIVAVAVVA